MRFRSQRDRTKSEVLKFLMILFLEVQLLLSGFLLVMPQSNAKDEL
jgi:hypothetical protein